MGRGLKLPPLLQGVLLRRYKRFLADIELADGRRITAHCPNTGAMTGCAEPGWRVWVSVSDNPKRKYAHTWELVETDTGIASVNTGRANALVAEALAAGAISLSAPVHNIQPEARIPEGDGRFDFCLETAGRRVYVEVKSVTLHVGAGEGAFPDAVSSRALKHLQALRRRVAAGDGALLIFCAQHSGVQRVRAAAEIDAQYAQALAEVHAAGVQVAAYGCAVDPQQVVINRPLPVSQLE